MQGTIEATIKATGSFSVSPSSITIICTYPSGPPVSTNIPFGSYFPSSYSQEYSIDLSRLKSGLGNTINVQGVNANLVLTSSPTTTTQQSSSTTTGTQSASTARSSSTTITTARTTRQTCASGEILGGLPSGPICYPPGIQVAESGSASVVDLSGNPTDGFVPGHIVSTGSNSLYGISYQGTSVAIGPNAVVGWIPMVQNNNGSFSAPPESPQFFSTLDRKMAELGAKFGLEAVTDLALKHVLVMASMGELSASVLTSGLSMIMVGLETIHYEKNTVLPAITNTATCLGTAQIVGCPEGSEYVIRAQNNGTTIYDIKGSFVLSTFSTNQTITLQAGQSLFVPSNLAQPVRPQSFDSSTINRWWSALSYGPSTTSSASSTSLFPFPFLPTFGLTEVAVIAALAAILVALAVALRRSRLVRSSGAQRAVLQPQRPDFCPNCGTLIGSQTFCENCGTRLR